MTDETRQFLASAPVWMVGAISIAMWGAGAWLTFRVLPRTARLLARQAITVAALLALLGGHDA